MKTIIYYFLLIIIIFLSFDLISKCKKRCPRKIRGIIIIMSMLMIISKVSLLYLSITNDSNNAIIMSYFMNTNMIYIPCITIILTYIFTRNNKIKFTSIYPILLLFIVNYIVWCYLGSETITISKNFGYEIISSTGIIEKYIMAIIMIFMSIILFKGLLNRNGNSIGMIFLIIVCFSCSFEYLAEIFNVNVFPYPVISEVIVIMISYYGINTFKSIKQV